MSMKLFPPSANEAIELEVRSGTLGPDVFDISKLSSNGYFAFDVGFVSTAACESRITYIDGEAGILLHRGYPIEQLAEYADYLEVCALLLSGELPQADRLEEFRAHIMQTTVVNEQAAMVLAGFPADAHPMAMLMALVTQLAASHNQFDVHDPNARQAAAFELIAKIPTFAAMCHRHRLGHSTVTPDTSLSFTANFLGMLHHGTANAEPINPVLAAALDRIFILHADHEQNASTSTVRLCGSSGVNPFAAISAGIATLWGPAHGGANEAALNMLKEIGDVSRIGQYIDKAKDKNDPFRLMGFGHRVYKNFDPRATVMRSACHDVLATVQSGDDPLLKIALELEAIALEDDYFIQRKLYPNIDFYSGITLSALGIPTQMFTVIFALARTVGWMAHWNEMWQYGPHRIGRPRQLYTGQRQRDYVLPEERG